MNEAQRLAKAKADYEAALAETGRLKKDAEEKIKAAEVAQRAAFMEMESSQMAADKLLPVCVMHACNFRTGTHEKLMRRVAKRTSKTVFVKIAGQPDERAQAFRIGKTGRWYIYLRQDLWASMDYWIEFPEESQSATEMKAGVDAEAASG